MDKHFFMMLLEIYQLFLHISFCILDYRFSIDQVAMSNQQAPYQVADKKPRLYSYFTTKKYNTRYYDQYNQDTKHLPCIVNTIVKKQFSQVIYCMLIYVICVHLYVNLYIYICVNVLTQFQKKGGMFLIRLCSCYSK